MTRRIVTWVAVAAALAAWAAAAEAQPARVPNLVVVLVVDQMRGDYIDRYGHQWTRGLHRLVTEGALFRRAAYPYANTVTCAGHATVSTGTLPATHGITGNSWFDRVQWKTVPCTATEGATAVSYGLPVARAHGPALLMAPTLADEMRAQLPGPTRVVTMSVKARSAIMLAGHRGDAVTWYDPAARGLVTSSAYTNEPVPFVAAFAKANPIDADFATPWTRALPVGRYLFEDEGAGEKPPTYWTRAFPHPFSGNVSADDAWTAWEGSPRSDAYLGRLAIAAVDALKLGQGVGSDFLGISFSAVDGVGHDFGPKSHEVQDTLVRLDETIGALLSHLDRAVGPGRYVVALTGDHGAPIIPERSAADGFDAGRLRVRAVANAAQAGLQRALGPGEYRIRQVYTELFVEPVVLEALRANPSAAETVVRALRAVPGVAASYFADTLDSHAAAGDRDARAALAGYVPGRSGDFIVQPRPNWFFVNDDGSAQPGDATSHGTPYVYDQQVPLVLFGRGIRPGEYLRQVTPADIAPTLALLCGVTLARPDGEVLTEAIAPPPPQMPAAR
jgi:predicted AlkP superfamily pyrophosphatase or phosphodiesterase